LTLAMTGPGAAPAETPLALQLQVDGVGGDARLRGELRQGEFSAKVLNSRLRVEDQVLDLDPLRLELLDGTVVARGTADFNDPANASFRFATNARGIQWGSPTALAADADFGLAGTLQAWALIGNATLTRDGERATLTLDGRGNNERMDLKALDVAMPTGTLAATGRIAWAPSLAWDIDSRLAGFDPGYFAAGWNGSINGHITSTGSARDDGGLEATLDLADLGGRLHGKPLDGNGHFTMSGASPTGDVARYQGELALSIGGSRINAKGSYGNRVDVDARFAPLNLQDLLPDASGTLRGTARVLGPAAGPDVRADLVGSNLKFADYSASTLTIKGELPWSRGDGQLAIRGDGLAIGAPVDRLVIDARGAVEQLRLSATAGREGLASLALDASLNHRGNRWQGNLSRLAVDMERGADWNLRAPAGFAWTPAPNGSSATLEQACLASTAGGSLCINADWPGRGLSVVGEGLPVALVEPYLPEREHRQPWLLRGELAIDAHIRPVGSGWDGEARITSAGGGIRNSERSRTELLSYDNLALKATFRPQGIEAELGTGFNGDGRIDASLRTGWDAWSPLSGQLSLNTRELTWMELFSPDIVEPTGRLNAQITVAGTRDTPQLGGQARLADFSTELPALAITLREGNVQLDAMADGSARIHGSVRSASSAGNDGNGVLNINGTLGWKGDETPLVLRLSGTDVLVSDTPDLRAVASPDLQLNYQIGQPTRLTGTILVPEAMVNLEGLDHAVSPSADVVVLDPVNPDDGPGAPLAMDLRITVGDDVRMKGFGLTGKVDGNMHLLARPGRELAATGAINVAGEYKAYGQDLTITRGLLSWSNDPVSNPVVNLRAERVIGEVTAGVDVSGRATAPQASVWSNPASSQPEALAYLTLGRPLSTLSGDQRGDLNAANAALTAGGGMLASQLATRIGLEDAGVTQSRALGSSVFGFGKQLSPRMYVGYGVSLLGTGQVLTLKYLLDHGFDIEIESSTLEDRGSINWRKEK
ncbi:translocation/assembly module TamB domain-containing protein, partial [Lysobacter sp. A03]|uniref:translocation/assembly module TamB domain-containing protein n=1 Tax=Lysobacter sp. A03 TaxID=1199154 RepID=UPI0005C563A5